MISFGIIASIAILLVSPFDIQKKKTLDDVETNEEGIVDDSNREQLLANEKRETSFKTITNIIDESDKTETIKHAICSRKFFACFFMSLCSSCNNLLFKILNSFLLYYYKYF